MALSITAILADIAEGEHDGALDQIVEVIRLRRQYLSKAAALRLYVNDRVRLNDECRPRHPAWHGGHGHGLRGRQGRGPAGPTATQPPVRPAARLPRCNPDTSVARAPARA